MLCENNNLKWWIHALYVYNITFWSIFAAGVSAARNSLNVCKCLHVLVIDLKCIFIDAFHFVVADFVFTNTATLVSLFDIKRERERARERETTCLTSCSLWSPHCAYIQPNPPYSYSHLHIFLFLLSGKYEHDNNKEKNQQLSCEIDRVS